MLKALFGWFARWTDGAAPDVPGSASQTVAAITSATHALLYATATHAVSAITGSASALGSATATTSVQAIGSATHTVAPVG